MTPIHAYPFPDDLWTYAGLPDKPDRLEQARHSLDEIEFLQGAPRNPSLVEDFLNQEVPEGRLLVYGAGTHTPPVLEVLQRRRRNTIIGIIDRMGEHLKTFQGHSVFTPQEATLLPYDYILLSHGTYEDEMLESLRELGVPSRRIISIYTHDSFRKLARQTAEKRLGQFLLRSFDTFIISCTQTVIVPDRELAAILSPDRTLNIHFGRPDSFDPSGPFETINLHESLDDLAYLIECIRPRNIYVRSIAYKNYLGYWLKKRYPEVKVIHELYDHTVVWPDRDLKNLFGLTQRTIRRLRLTEYAGAQFCDLIISKRGGPDWASILQESTAPYCLYYPMVQSPGPILESTGEATPSGLIYAGFLPAPAFRAQFKNGYDFLSTLEKICSNQKIRACLYNAAHVGPDADRIYAPYLDTYRGTAEMPVEYCRRLPYETLLKEMQSFAYGWLCDKVHEFQADRYVGICNRWTGYVSAGLPVIIDSGWRLMAELTRSYNAGLVVDDADASQIIAAMRKADPRVLRQGSQQLRSHLLRHNDGTQAVIADTIRTERN